MTQLSIYQNQTQNSNLIISFPSRSESESHFSQLNLMGTCFDANSSIIWLIVYSAQMAVITTRQFNTQVLPTMVLSFWHTAKRLPWSKWGCSNNHSRMFISPCNHFCAPRK